MGNSAGITTKGAGALQRLGSKTTPLDVLLGVDSHNPPEEPATWGDGGGTCLDGRGRKRFQAFPSISVDLQPLMRMIPNELT